MREMQNWQDLAFRKLKKSQPLTFEWEARDIPADVADGIRARLAEATDEAGIKAAFEVSRELPQLTTSVVIPLQDDNAEIKTLADALNNMAAAMMVQPAEVKAETVTPVPQPITINLTAQMPAPGEPSITVNVPEVAPGVNVTNEVQPAAVTVTNEVQPAPVKVEKPKRAKVVRDVDGRITGIEA